MVKVEKKKNQVTTLDLNQWLMVKQENIMAKCHFSNYTAGQALQKKNSYKQKKQKKTHRLQIMYKHLLEKNH